MTLKHIVFDTETLGIRENAIVLSIGAVAFELEPGTKNDYDRYILDGFHVKFSIKDQLHTWKRSVDEGTVEWWKGQSEEAKKILKPSPNDVTMAEGLTQLNDWIKSIDGYKWNSSYVWSRGTYFDFPKMESMYHQAGVKCGFNTWKIRDVRTYIDILTGVDNGKYEPDRQPENFIAHDALHDAAMDAYRMVEIFNKNS